MTEPKIWITFVWHGNINGELWSLGSRYGYCGFFYWSCSFSGSVVSLGEVEEQRGKTLVGIYSFFDSQ